MPGNYLLRGLVLPRLGRVTRLGLATRGDSQLTPDDVLTAVGRGINYLNWCGCPDGMREAIRGLGKRRGEVKIAVQLEARGGAEAKRELDVFLRELATNYLDVVTYYYVEHADEWAEIIAPGGAAEVLEGAREQGVVRAIGLTSHQRRLAAEIAESGRLDLLMIRYNAAHRGAEEDVFPITSRRNMPVVAFTCLRWGALLQPTPDDPPGFVPPPAADWYRFTLSHPAVSVALMAPRCGEELRQNLSLLDGWQALTPEQHAALAAHGQRVRRHAGAFP
jgi:predicted aldo/keto reductase-like oxidoreductase